MKGFTPLLIAAVTVLSAQDLPPQVENAQFQTRPYHGDLASELHSNEPAWFSYAIQSVAKEGQSCCWNGNGNGCWLEKQNYSEGRHIYSGAQTPVQLEASNRFVVLVRIEDKRVDKIHVFSQSCPLNAGGLPFVWLSAVPMRDSLQFLQTLVELPQEAISDNAVFAVAQHNIPEADAVLRRLITPAEPMHTREKAIFWMGASRGASGVASLAQLLANDKNDEVREKAIFALSISKEPEAVDDIIHAARSDPSPHVRGQALFWLAQKAGKRASETITNAIATDPNTEVKKSAVFAISQLPKSESVPKLIEIARTQGNAEVQKQAFFWLGQSHDPRALAFLEQVLTR